MDIRIAGTNIAQRDWTNDQLSRLSIELSAFDGEVGVGAFAMPDPSGADDFAGAREIRVVDAGIYIVDGFIGDQIRTRAIFPNTPQREHLYTLRDPNALLYGFRVHQQRPSEPVHTRVLAFAAAYRPTWTTTMVLSTSPVTMPAKNYGGANGFEELIQDIRDISGKTLFVHDLPDGGRCLHMHRLVEGHTAGISVSDVASAVNGVTVFAPHKYPVRTFSVVDLKNDVVGRDQAGRTATVTDQDSIDRHNADGLQHDAIVEFEASSQAELFDKTQQYVTEYSTERQTYEVTIGPLDFASMALWRIGDLLNVTSDVLGMPGTVSPIRIAHATITISRDESGKPLPGYWDCHFELGSPIRSFRPRPTRKIINGQTVTPFIPSGAPTFVKQAAASSWNTDLTRTATFAASGTAAAGNLLVAVGGASLTALQFADDFAWPAGWTRVDAWDTLVNAGNHAMTFATKIADGTETGVTLTYTAPGGPSDTPDGLSVAILEFDGGGYLTHTRAAGAVSANQNFGDVTPGTSQAIALIALGLARQGQSPGTVTGYSQRSDALGSSGGNSIRINAWTKNVAAPTGTYSATITYGGALDRWGGGHIVIAGDVGDPEYGQRTCEQFTGDGSDTTRTLNFPYIPGSLTVTQDGIAAVVTETDPTAGTYTTATATANTKAEVACYQIASSTATGAGNPQPTPNTPSVSGGVTVQDEGTPLSTTGTTLNFVGSGVTATGSGATKTITIPGGGTPGFVGAKAYNSATQSVADATDTKMLMNTDEFDTNAFHFTSAANLTGTVSKTASSATITGSGTSFTTELAVNQVISIPGTAVEKFVVKSIESNTSLTAWANAANTATGQTGTRVNSAMAIPATFAGTYMVGGHVQCQANGTGVRAMRIMKNGATVNGTGFQFPGNAGASVGFESNSPIALAEGDYVELNFFQNSTTSLTTGGTNGFDANALWLYLIGT